MNQFYTYALAALVGYTLGVLPTAWLVGRFYGVDVLAGGSGNMGATNVGRLIGRRAAVLVAAIDLGKGALAAWLGQALFPALPEAALLAGLAALIGHVWSVPLWLLARRLRGGRGVATATGASLLLMPSVTVLVAAVVLGVLLGVTRVTAWSTLGAAGSGLLVAAVLYWLGALSLAQLAYALGVCVVLVATHAGKLLPLRSRIG